MSGIVSFAISAPVTVRSSISLESIVVPSDAWRTPPAITNPVPVKSVNASPLNVNVSPASTVMPPLALKRPVTLSALLKVLSPEKL